MWYYWLIAFLGLVAGFILGKYTKEELKDGKKYFILLERLILFILIVFMLYRVDFSLLVVFCFFVGMLFFYKLDKSYFYLGMLMVLSLFLSKDFLMNVTFLIFVFGLPYGSIFYQKKKIKEITWNLIYFAIPLILLLVNNYVMLNVDYFLAFTSGALFFNFVKKIR